MGEFGTGSKIVYWGDLKQRDEKMRAMRGKYELNESRRALIREACVRPHPPPSRALPLLPCAQLI